MAYNLNNLKKVAFALNNAGATGKEFVFLLTQAAQETGNFNKGLLVSHNNASGITWANKPYQLNATKGNPLPEAPKYNYARFASLNDWARDYRRITRKATAAANNIVEYAAALKKQNYYKAKVEEYTAGMLFHFKELSKIYTQLTGNKLVIPAATSAASSTNEKKTSKISQSTVLLMIGAVAVIFFLTK
jgi:hypothetical protein